MPFYGLAEAVFDPLFRNRISDIVEGNESNIDQHEGQNDQCSGSEVGGSQCQ